MNGDVPGRFGPGGRNKIDLPKSAKEVPKFLGGLVSGFMRRLFYIFKLVWDTSHWIMIAMTVLTVLSGVLPVFLAYVASEIVNVLAESVSPSDPVKIWQTLLILFGMNVLIRLAESVVSTFERMLNSIAGELVANHIKVQLMLKADKIDVSRFDLPDFYENLENANREAGSRPLQILSATFSLVSSVISMFSFIMILWSVSPWAPFVIFFLSLPSAVVNFVYRRKRFNYMRRRSKDRRQMQYYSNLMTNKDMVKEIRVLSIGKVFIQRYKEVFSRYYAGLKKLIMHENIWHIVMNLVKVCSNVGILLYVARRAIDGTMKIGNYTLSSSALTSVSNGIGTLISSTATIYEGALFIDNVIAFMNEQSCLTSIVDAPLHPARRTEHTFVFENVSFSYPGRERMVLKDLSFTLRPGETAVLVGINGAGKTTLIKLLMRLYDPTSGRILMDGHDIREYDLAEYYRMFGVIFQDFGKYAVNVSENISFGDIEKEPTEKAVAEAADQSGASDYIRDLSDGYNTPLMRIFEENGIELSGGQWQKLAIARAFYSESDIIILDEPTASLDAIAEQEIYNQFDRLRKDKITIFVSHRLSSATLASKILVLDGGKLVEEGTHKELIQKNEGVYHNLFTLQASRYLSDAEERGKIIPTEDAPAPNGNDIERGTYANRDRNFSNRAPARPGGHPRPENRPQ